MKRTAEFMAATAAAVLLAASAPAGEIRKAELPMISRLAPVTAVDAETRIVTLTWTTGAEVTRFDWWSGKRYIEQLDVSSGACDLSRLNAGAPLLNSHDMYSLESQIGVVERAWIENGEGKAEVRFPKQGLDPAADLIFSKVQDKIIRNVSVGYLVRKYQITDNQGDGLDVWRAVDWQPMEISLVTIPADAGAGVRSETDSMHTCEFTRAAPASNKETEMTLKTAPAPGAAPADDEATRAAALATQQATQTAVEAERKRGIAIRAKVKTAGLPDEVGDDLIGRGVAEDHAANHILDELAKRGGPVPRPAGEVRITNDERQTRNEAVENAILHRCAPDRFKLTDQARQFRGARLLEIGRDLLVEQGEKVRGLMPMDLSARILNLETRSYNTTSDLPNILANVANKFLQAGYAAEKRTFMPFGSRRDVPDFKQISSIQMGEGSNLEQVNEKGEFKRGSVSDSAEKYALATYGKIFAFSRQALINDDLSAFSRLPMQFGSAGVRLENDIVWNILINNAAMADTVALFHATHSNLQTGAGSALQVSSLATMRKQFRQQKGVDSKQTLNLEMRSIAVCSALETTLEQLMSPLLYASASASIVTEFIKALTPIVEPRLDAISSTVWFGFTDPSQMESLEYAYLEGQDGVYLETRTGFDVDGTEFKVRHDFAAKAVNYRGAQKSAGA